MELSVVSPCYGAPTLLRQLVKEITEAVAPLTERYEILLRTAETSFVKSVHRTVT